MGKAALSGLLATALIGMPLAMLGLLRPWLTVPAVAAGAVFAWRQWPMDVRRAPGERALVPALAVLLVVGWGAYNAKQAGERLIADNDPGVYAVTGKWLAEEGRIPVDTHSERFGDETALRFSTGAFAPRGDGRLDPQFAHFLPIVLALGEWIGGSWFLFKINALVGALGLLAVFLFARRFTGRPWLALAATALLALALPQIYFARSSYSEPLQQLLLFGGLWALWAARDGGRRAALIAGLLLGMTVMTRLDGLLLLPPLAVALAVEAWRSSGGGTPSRPLWAGAGMVVTGSLGLLDVAVFAPFYLEDVRAEAIGLSLVVLAVLATGAAGHASPGLRARAAGAARAVARPVSVVVAVVVAVGAAALVARDPKLTWYLGAVPVVLAIAGLALAWHGALGRGRGAGLAFLVTFTAVGGAYVLEPPNITPLHVEVMRRFVALVIPGTLVLATVPLAHLLAARPGPRALLIAAAVLIAAASLWVPLRVLAPIQGVSPQVGLRPYTEELCALVPRDAVVLVSDQHPDDEPSGYPLSAFYTIPLRVFCDVPAASVPADPALIGRVAGVQARAGRRLVVITQVPEPPTPGARQLGAVVSAFSDLALVEGRVPRNLSREAIAAYVWEIPS